MGALKQLAIKAEELADAILDDLGFMPLSPAWQEYHDKIVARIDKFLEEEFFAPARASIAFLKPNQLDNKAAWDAVERKENDGRSPIP